MSAWKRDTVPGVFSPNGSLEKLHLLCISTAEFLFSSMLFGTKEMFTNLSNGMGHVHFTLHLTKDSETSMCLNPIRAYQG